MKVAIVEDEGITAMFLKETVLALGHEVVLVSPDGAALLQYMKKGDLDLVFMDINIKGTHNGIEVAQEVQKLQLSTSIVFVSAYKDNDTITKACDVAPLGYLTKPVQPLQLETLLILAEKQRKMLLECGDNILQIGAYTYDVKARVLQYEDAFVSLSTQEHYCLHALLAAKGKQVRSTALIESIWGSEENRGASLRELLTRLRKKISELDLQNIPNIGYRLVEKT